jgi:molybdate transport system substrate-binding protein
MKKTSFGLSALLALAVLLLCTPLALAAHDAAEQHGSGHNGSGHNVGHKMAESSGPLSITTGAGYRMMLEKLCAAYRADGGTVEEMYGGHIAHMLTQIRQGNGVKIVVSDKGTLDATAQGLEFDQYENLGDTLLVLAWRKGINLKTPEDLTLPEVKSVVHPDSQAAIYGRAAKAFLESSGLGQKISAKVQVVSSVPQVLAYLVSGEMDAGFVNRAVIMNNTDKIGGSMEISGGYPSLNMVAAVVKGQGNDPEVKKFLNFLKTPQAKSILKNNGIW